jgi:hypothetical protein
MATLPEIDIFVFLNGKAPNLTQYFDSMLNFEFRTSFCRYLCVIIFDLNMLFFS